MRWSWGHTRLRLTLLKSWRRKRAWKLKEPIIFSSQNTQAELIVGAISLNEDVIAIHESIDNEWIGGICVQRYEKTSIYWKTCQRQFLIIRTMHKRNVPSAVGIAYRKPVMMAFNHSAELNSWEPLWNVEQRENRSTRCRACHMRHAINKIEWTLN